VLPCAVEVAVTVTGYEVEYVVVDVIVVRAVVVATKLLK
jgi:hypothetical protein